jgi:DNA-binding transcriptional ArsR family regulator
VMNFNMPPKSTQTASGAAVPATIAGEGGVRPPAGSSPARPGKSVDQPGKLGQPTPAAPASGDVTRGAIIRALSSHPGATVRELCVMVGRSSTSTVYMHLTRLEAEGKIVRDDCPLCRGKIWRVQ